MNSNIEYMIVIGCSYGGKEASEYLIPRLDLVRSVAVVVPHITKKEIFDSLKNAGVPVHEIEGKTHLDVGNVYVVDHHFYGSFFTNDCPLFKRLKSYFKTVKFKEGYIKECHSIIPLPINYAFISAAMQYSNTCIAVVLSGYGPDGSFGVKLVKYRRGKVLVQSDNSDYKKLKIYSYVDEMPKNAKASTKVDFAGSLTDLVHELNKVIMK